MKKKTTLDMHLELVPYIAAVEANLLSAAKIIHNNFPKSSPQVKKVMALDKNLSKLKCALDEDYHALINDDQFKELGHIYYNLRARYNPDGSEIETTLAE